MAINASIPLGIQPLQIQPPDPNQGMNALARMMQIRGMQDEAQMNALKMDEYKRGIEDQNALRSALSAPDADPYKVLLGRGRVKEAGDFIKSQNEAKNAEASRLKTELEMGLKKAEHAASVLSLARDPASYATVRAVIKQQFGQDLPEQFDPEMVNAIIAQGQTLTQRLAAEHQRLTLAETGRHNLASEANTVRGQNITAETTRRGQNMVDARSREANAQGRVPAGYRAKPDGSLEFIPGGPADPNAAKKAAPTEFQGKAAMFGTRAQEADRIITELDGKYSPTGINTKQAVGGIPLIGGGVEAGANLMLSGASQKAEQAQRDFINAVLRLESGAAIAESEFNNAKKQYFPQPGDSKAVIAQKAANRKTAIQGLMNNARTSAAEPAKQSTGEWGAGWKIEKVN